MGSARHGRSVVRPLAGDGSSVVVGFGSNYAEEHAAAAEAEGTGAKATAVAADVGDEQAVARLFDRAEEHFGGVDVVVNAAGLMSLAPLADFDLAVLDRMLRTNIRGTFVVSQQAACRVRPGGAIINFSSSVLGRVLPAYTGYAASKAAVEATTFILAHELRGRDVTVNAVAPGPTATDLFLEGKDRELLDRLADAAPLGRPPDPRGSPRGPGHGCACRAAGTAGPAAGRTRDPGQDRSTSGAHAGNHHSSTWLSSQPHYTVRSYLRDWRPQ